MREKIIIASGINGSELIKSMAKSGRDTIGLSVVTPAAAVKQALIRAGQFAVLNHIGTDEQVLLMLQALKGNTYFTTSSLADAQAVTGALNSARLFFSPVGDELEHMERFLHGGVIPEKSRALLKIFQNYLRICSDTGVVDSVSFLRVAYPILSKTDVEVFTLREFPLKPLELSVITAIAIEPVEITDVCSLTGRDSLHDTVSPEISEITGTYGAYREAEHIIKDVLKRGLRFDEVLVATATPSVSSQIFLDVSQRYNIPLTFGTGIPIAATNPGKLLNLISRWAESGFYRAPELRDIISSECFEVSVLEPLKEQAERECSAVADKYKMLEIAGALRLGMNAEENSRKVRNYENILKQRENRDDILCNLRFAALLFEHFEKGYAHAIDVFTRIRKSDSLLRRFDTAGRQAITEYLDLLEGNDVADCISGAVSRLLQTSVGSQSSSEGCLHLADIKTAQCVLRKRLYICGLSANVFPGKAVEDPVLLDDDYCNGLSEDKLPTSEQKIAEKLAAFHTLTSLYSQIGRELSLSYPYYDPAELKASNPSSAIFDFYKKANAQDADYSDFIGSIQKEEYFQRDSISISETDALTEEYIGGKTVPPAKASERLDYQINIDELLQRSFSPTAIEQYRDCHKKFYYHHILRLSEPRDEDDAWLGGAQAGTLVHSILEQHSSLSASEARAIANETLDEYAAENPPLSDTTMIREDFIRTLEEYYLRTEPLEVLNKEHEIKAELPTGLKISGKSDLLAKDAQGRVAVVDYKTGRTIKNDPENPDSFLQILLYALMFEKSGQKPDYCEYRYLRYPQIIKLEYDEEMQAKAKEIAWNFEKGLRERDFSPTDNIDVCKYCGFSELCGIEVEDDE